MRRSAISRTALWAIIAVVVIVVVVGGVAAYYATRPPPPKPTPTPTPTPTHAIVGQVTVGLEQSLTGPLGPIGEEVLWGAQLAASQINSQGGIYMANGPNGPGNYTINLVWQDDQTNPSDGPTATSTLITSDHAAILITSPASAVAIADIPVIQQYNEPSIFICSSPLATRTSNLTNFDPSKYMIFHYQPTGIQYGEWAAEFLHDYASQISPSGVVRIVYVGQNTEYGQDYFWGLNYTIYKNGWQNQLKIVDTEYYPFGSTQFQSILSKIATESPNAIVLGSFPNEEAAFQQQAATVPALKGVVMGPSTGIVDDMSFYGPSAAGADAAGTFISTNYPEYAVTSNATINAKWATFRQAYKALSGQQGNLLGASGYDAVWAAAYALHDAGTTQNTAVINALATMSPPPQLVVLVKPSSTGTLFNSFHEVSLQPLELEVFWNSTSGQPYTQVVWPSQYATASPQFGIFP
ncbi:MAG: ABC transporter substrate-binding protein [Conexivisphaerales archaeon]|nr:ABC transporter substrate-binding protein [Conexivisphaerales archaeon]